MTKKIFFFILIAVFIGTLVSEAPIVQATARELEIEYPSVPLVQTPNTVKTLIPDYIRYVIVFGIIISGLIIFGSLVYAGFLYMTSSGNPAALKNSKDRMLSSFLGIIILLSSYLILNTINPNLIELKIDPRTSAGGVAFIDASGERYVALTNVHDFEVTGISQPVSVEFLSSDVEVIPCRDINNFEKSNCENLYSTITSNGSFPGDTKAAKLIWKIPGVYLYDQTDYRGELRIYTTSQGALTHFNNKAESINFLPPPRLFAADNRFFGAVLHESEGFENECKFIWNAQADLGGWNNKTGSLTVFKYKSSMPYDGGGVKFYKEPIYQDDPGGYFTNQNTNWTNFDFNNTDNNIYSIKIDGDYLVAIAENSDGSGKCEIFFESHSDLSDNPIGQCTLLGQCSPGCWGWPPYFCPVCTGSCATSFIVIPLGW